MSEKRKHQRVKTPEETFVVADGCMGKVIDISKGGLSLMLLTDISANKQIPKKISLDLLSHDDQFHAREIQGKLTWKEDVLFPDSYGIFMKFGVQFQQLSNKQQGQLEKLLLNCTQ